MAQGDRNPEIAPRDSSLVEPHSSTRLPIKIAGYHSPPPRRIAMNSTTLPAEMTVEPAADVSSETSHTVDADLPGPRRSSKSMLLFTLFIGAGAILGAFFVSHKLDQPSPAQDSKTKVMNSDPPGQPHPEQRKQEQARSLEGQKQPDAGLEPEINWNKNLKRQLQEMEKTHKKPGRAVSPRRPREEEWEPGPAPKKEIPPELRDKTKD